MSESVKTEDIEWALQKADECGCLPCTMPSARYFCTCPTRIIAQAYREQESRLWDSEKRASESICNLDHWRSRAIKLEAKLRESNAQAAVMREALVECRSTLQLLRDRIDKPRDQNEAENVIRAGKALSMGYAALQQSDAGSALLEELKALKMGIEGAHMNGQCALCMKKPEEPCGFPIFVKSEALSELERKGNNHGT